MTPPLLPGCAPAFRAVRGEVNARTCICARERCGLLVDWKSAKGKATKARRELQPGDGCRGAHCGGRTSRQAGQRAERKKSQCRMARELMEGKRKLVAWPATLADDTVWKWPEDFAIEKAREILARFGENGLTE